MALQEVKDLEKRVAALEKKVGVSAEKIETKKTEAAKPQSGG